MPRPPPPGPPSEDRLDGALRYASAVERGRSRSRRRRTIPLAELQPTTLEALARAEVASECIVAALRRVREARRATPSEPVGHLSAADERLSEAGAAVERARAELERFLGRRTFLDGATEAAAAGDGDKGER